MFLSGIKHAWSALGVMWLNEEHGVVILPTHQADVATATVVIPELMVSYKVTVNFFQEAHIRPYSTRGRGGRPT